MTKKKKETIYIYCLQICQTKGREIKTKRQKFLIRKVSANIDGSCVCL